MYESVNHFCNPEFVIATVAFLVFAVGDFVSHTVAKLYVIFIIQNGTMNYNHAYEKKTDVINQVRSRVNFS